ncbi:MAG: tetratricopeptide repeat protein, partial [Acidobacteriaceae bacterium]|nr:tetratricopeptide repeat protein [Acidobacteriaceae bacterium]
MATAAALTAVEKPAPTGIDQYRYPGPKEFEDTPESHRRFFGRDAEIRAITQQIMASRLLVLYGNSGLGKSSLLKAGVFPVLRAEALLPIRVRLKASTDLLKLIAESCEEVSREFNIDYSPGTGDTCWEFFKTAMFWRGDTLLLPVLVFDQFEEIFTLMDAEWRKNFALDLGPLVSGSLPPAVREKLRSGTSGLSDVPPKVKVVFSLREEYYGSLQDLSSDLPTLFQDRFRLLPLDESQARDAIQKPALLDAASDSSSASQLLSPPFHYSEETLAAMLKFLKGRSQTIEPFQLQLLCQHVEQVVVESKRLAAAQPPIEIAPDDLGGEQAMALVLRRFYANTLNQLPALERRRARELCDSGLLSPAGHRLMLQEDQIRHEYGVSATTLKYLVDRRILRQEPRLESMFYEISHDTIAQSISRTRGWRFPKKWRLALIVAAASLIVLFAFGLLTILSLTREQNQTNEARRKADEERNKAENLVAFLIGEDLLSKIRPVGQLDIMEDIQREVNKSYSKTKETTDVGMRNQGLAYLNQGDLDYAHYFLQKAQGNYDSALKLFETLLSRNADNPDWQHDRADAKAKLAHVFADQLQLPQALELSREALKIQEELVGRNAGNGGETLDRLLREEAQSYIAVGEILSRQGHLREALEYFQKCLDAAKSKDTTEWLYIREDGLLGKGNVFFPQGDVRGAEIAFNEAYKTAQRAFEKSPFAPEAQYKIALAASNLAKLPSQTPENTLRNLRTAHETIQKTATWDPTNMRWKRDLAATYILLANGDGNPESARAEYSKALEIIGQLATIDRTNKILNQDLISLHLSIGDALLSNTASSASIFSGVESEAERVTTMLGSNAGANAPGKAAVLAHGSPARRTDATGQSQMSNEALEQYESGLKLAGTLEETDQTDNDLHDESIGLALREARLLRGESHFDRALEFSDRANKELEKLFVDPTDNLRLELRGLIHEEKGGAFLGRHESSKAAEELSSASADINTLTRERAANAQYWNDKFLLSYEFAAALSAQRNDKPGTFDAYREAVEAEEKA